ncbi:hypothetical protein [Desulfovibrio aminophilus]|uniref:hypothetical protein n=1 Tax=Desulfovibrio aminophilus TaxID=81425 RepID=UPI0033975A69
MPISREIALAQIIEALEEINEQADVTITANTNPIAELKLDSGHGLPFACELEVRLSIEIPVEVNPFVVDSPRPRARTVGEIADLLVEISAGQQGGE